LNLRLAMKTKKPATRIEASEPRATEHLSRQQKQALDIAADAEHTDGTEREKQTRDMTRLGSTHKAHAQPD